ncbi:MAG TPA: DUF1565 domain-containing protein, partial [bacterium]|nr:DUF1565 domain-containing protein [bacterium]
MNQAFCVSVLLLAVALNLAGCSSSSSPKPVTALELSVDSTACEVCNTVRVTATVHGGDSKAVDWYVNGAFGGQVTTGTVTQTNPTTFTAPEAVPVEPVVQIKAVSQEEPSIADSCVVRIAFTTIHVNAASGNDQTGTGCITHPLKTITHALAAAQPNMTVLVAPGLYDATNGDTFPMNMTGRITLVGESQTGTIIRTHANVYCALIMNGDSPRVRRLTIDNGGIADTTREHVIYVNGDATGAGIDSLIIPDRAYLSMIRVAAATNTANTNCQFIAQGTVKSRCFEIVFGDSGTIIRNCLISGFIDGIFFNG